MLVSKSMRDLWLEAENLYPVYELRNAGDDMNGDSMD